MVDKHGGGDGGQQGLIRWHRRCGTATEDIWDDGDGGMGCKDGDRLGKYQQGTTTNLRGYCRFGIMGMADKFSGEESGGRAQWRRFGITGIETAAEDTRDGNRRDVGQRRWQNGSEER